jgi:hypothetical protein
MPWASAERNTEYLQPQAQGPVLLTTPLFAADNQPPVSLTVSANWNSGVLNGDGYKVLSAGVTSSLTGTLAIQRYIDMAGLVPQGAPSSVSLAAATPGILNFTDGLPYATFRVIVTNTGAGTTTLTNFAILMSAA